MNISHLLIHCARRDEAAGTLLKELDHIPLAITQAGAFIKRNKMMSLKLYLRKLCQFHLKVTDVLSFELHDPRRQGGTPNAIFLTWQISYQQIKSENQEAADKLSLIAVLDSQAVPRTLLIKGDEMEIAEMDAIQVLLNFSLIKGDQDCQFFSMHPLQQLVSSFCSDKSCYVRAIYSGRPILPWQDFVRELIIISGERSALLPTLTCLS